MQYRSFLYYYFVSFLLVSFLFSSFISLHLSRNRNLNPELFQPSLKKKVLLVELYDQSHTHIENPFFFSNHEHGGKNQSYDTYTNSSQSLQQIKRKTTDSLQKGKSIDAIKIHPLDSQNGQPQKREKSLGMKHVIHVQMDSKGEFSINTVNFKGAQYLIDTAKGILNYWVQFIPAAMIYNGFIKDNQEGVIGGILRFEKQNNQYVLHIIKPFPSGIINEGTINAFHYYTIPVSQEVNLKAIIVELKIQKNTLIVSSQFDFELQ